MVDIFDEVDEELRAERAQQLLKRYAGLIIAAALLVIAATGGWQAWRWWQARQDMAAGQRYLAAMALMQSPAAASNQQGITDDFDALARTAPEGYRTLARLQAAALRAQHGDLKGATALWNDVASDSSADPLLRDLASLLWCQQQIDTGDPALLEARLKALAEPGNAWRALAQEQLALLDLRQGRTEAAKTALSKLAQDVTAPNGVRERAAALLARLG
ncbi:MAG: tetratricopeptide repeat protein [Acetobacteraceae bacterium]